MPDFFTRETWRPGKKSRLRKRVKIYGGRKTAPAAFLAAAKLAGFKPGRPGCRLCCALKRDGTLCRRLAMRGFRGAKRMEAFGMLAMRGEVSAVGRSAAFKAERAAAVEGRSPPAPLESHAFADLSGRLTSGHECDWRRAWGTTGLACVGAAN